MKIIALTGGIGMGKSAAAEILRERGVPVVDTDQLAYKLTEPGEPALQEIRKKFGAGIVASDGRLQRDRLAEIVFADASERARLEAILHPRIKRLWREQVRTWRDENRPLAVVMIPLLFETHAEVDFDKVLCIACSAVTQRQRLLARGWTDRGIEQRNAAQLPIDQKIARSDFVIWNEGRLDVMKEQLSRVISTN
jgi:dephospho-CoA kinase